MTKSRDTADSINRIDSSAADATAITIDSSENVGIGTSSPVSFAKLHLSSTGTTGLYADGSQTSDANIFDMVVRNGTDSVTAISSKRTGANDAAALLFSTQATGGSITERMRILSGGGITFNGDTAAANALDDYEEGTWTVAIEFGNSSCTSTTSRARYIKVGNMVHVSATFQITGTPASGTFEIGGFPFTPSGNVETTGSVMLNNVSYTASTVNLCVYLYNLASKANVYGTRDNAGYYALSNSHVGTGDTIIFSLTYYT